jgi:phosphoglycolate phosphatase-like HAD superfamily hydrolase
LFPDLWRVLLTFTRVYLPSENFDKPRQKNYATLHSIMTSTKSPIKADTVLWDFDGTLANSAAKNIAITRQILAQVAPRLDGENLPRWLRNEANYLLANHGANHWRDLYAEFYGMSDDEISQAEPLWEVYQSSDTTTVKLFDGIARTVNALSALPQGICSANSSGNIRQILIEQGIDAAFQSVIGYENLPVHQQKPAPDGGLKCLREIYSQNHEEIKGKTIVFVGDHLADVICARGLADRLDPSNTVISVVVTYSGAQPQRWSMQPDAVVDKPTDLLDLLNT